MNRLFLRLLCHIHLAVHACGLCTILTVIGEVMIMVRQFGAVNIIG